MLDLRVKYQEIGTGVVEKSWKRLLLEIVKNYSFAATQIYQNQIFTEPKMTPYDSNTRVSLHGVFLGSNVPS